MHRQKVLVFSVVLWSLGSLPTAAQHDAAFEKIFNGTDLTGWNGDPTIWSVEDGTIVGRTTAVAPIEQNTFLIWQGEPVRNFRLELEFRIEGGNSGVQYRSKVVDADRWSVAGYQADMDAEARYTGILYEEQRRGILTLRGQKVTIARDGSKEASQFADSDELQQSIQVEQWNKYRIVARGARLRHFINGELMSDTTDRQAGERAKSGVLALQVHRGPPMTVQFRNIRLKRFEKRESAPEKRQSVEPGEAEQSWHSQSATPATALTVAPGFRVELLYSVPRETQGSWVAMTVDPRGRLIVSDEDGLLYRVTPPTSGAPTADTRVEPLKVSLGMAQGLLYANDSLYVVVNSRRDSSTPSGLYRARDTNGDDQYDDVQLLREIRGAGEHGPHAVIMGPDGQSLFVVGGNHTPIPQPERSRVPRIWDEDLLLPRMWDAHGHAVGILAPGGWICRTDLDGKQWELISIGYRNSYDVAFNNRGDLFAYDADMEWDIGAPWYRPTRVCHATSGSEFGWRSGSGKWPEYYPDSLPSVVDVGTGSPTGVVFGYGTDYPPPYHNALFVCDWSFGKLYAVHLQPSGASYQGTLEEFVTGAPLPLTDVVVNPHDGALYFTIGGRNTQSGVYRVSYDGSSGPQTGATAESAEPNEAALARQALEVWHGREDAAAIDVAWPYLDHDDRHVRFAARVAIEFQPVDRWQQRALDETRRWAAIEAAIALARKGDADDSGLPAKVAAMLRRMPWHQLSREQQLGLLRAYSLVLIRLAPADEMTREAILAHLDGHFPASAADLNRELSSLLAYLEAPAITQRILELQREAPTQEEQIHYAYALRELIPTAPTALQQTYFRWFGTAHSFRGGHCLEGFVEAIKNEALEQLKQEQRASLKDILAQSPSEADLALQLPSGPIVSEYGVGDVVQIWQQRPRACDHGQGRRLFARTLCFKCHRVGSEGGATGPDLTTVGRRFGVRDLAEAIVQPSKVMSDRFRATVFQLDDGRIVTGRVANLSGSEMMVVTNMLEPGNLTRVRRRNVESMSPSTVSEMPDGLLNTLQEEEVRNLLAYLISGGDADHEVYAGP